MTLWKRILCRQERRGGEHEAETCFPWLPTSGIDC